MKNRSFLIFLVLSLFLAATVSVAAEEAVKVIYPELKTIRETAVVNGSVQAYQVVRLSSQIGGTIADLKVEIGQEVEEGEVLLSFEDEELRVQLKQAQAALAIAQANYELLLKGATAEELAQVEAAYEQALASYEGAQKNLELLEAVYEDRTSQKQQLISAETQLKASEKQLAAAEEGLKRSQLNLEQALNGLEQAEQEYERMKYLYEEQVVTSQQFELTENQLENARLTVENARSAVENAQIGLEQAQISYQGALATYELVKDNYDNPTQLEQQLDAARTQVEVAKANAKMAKANLERLQQGARPEEVATAKANVQQAEAALEQLQIKLEETVLKSPIKGVVAQINFEEGEIVGPGNPIFLLLNLDQVYVQADVNAQLLKYLQIGEQVEVKVLAYPEKEFQGELVFISPMVDPQSQAFPIKVLLDNPQHLLKVGMFADLVLSTRENLQALTIPVGAVLDLDSEPRVFVVKNGQAEERLVEVGIIGKDEVEIIAGLSQDEPVIYQGQHNLRDGDPVKVVD